MADTKDLVPGLKVLMNKFISLCAAKGITVIVTQGFRTPAQQDAIYAQGRTTPGAIVTYLKGEGPNASKHCQGKAFDVCFLVNKKATYSGPWAQIGAIGKSIGLKWGGDFKGFADDGHFEI